MSTPRTLTILTTLILVAALGVSLTSAQDGVGDAFGNDRDARLRQFAEPAPSLRVDAQVSDNATVTISRVNLNTTGWVVIHADQLGAPGEVLGNSERLEEGLHVGVDVSVNLTADLNQTMTLHAMLHHDTGNATYDFPDGDPPMRNQSGAVVVHSFEVRIGDEQVVVANGPVSVRPGEDDSARGGDQGRSDTAGEATVPVALAKLNQSGYVVLHKDVGGLPGEVVGQSELLDAGVHEDIEIVVARMSLIFGDDDNITDGNLTDGNDTDDQNGNWTRQNVTLWAMIHIDDGDGEYQFPGPDVPVTVGATPVMTPFSAIPADEDDDVGEDVGDGDGEDGEGEDGDTPGFTLVVALASVLLALGFLRNKRRA